MSPARPLSAVALAVVLAAAAGSCADPQRPELTITPAGGTVAAGQSVQLTATRRYPGAAPEVVTQIMEWSSSNPAALRVTDQGGQKGLVTGALATPVAFVRVHDPLSGVTQSVSFVVNAPEVSSILVSPSPALVLTRAQTRALTATATLTDGSTADVTASVVWASSNLTAATVADTGKDKGLVTAVAPGRSDVTATDPVTRVVGTTSVFVSGPGDVRAITVAPNPASVAVGGQLRFVAVGHFADGTSQELTQQVAWQTSRVAVASIAPGGSASGLTAGETTITAVDPTGAVRGSALLTVTP
ncbi:MAG: Ig-like domain-containing protein [Myxococcales bacterium]|jgi:hypothetical protein|nr:Ig-like domain-containing protein [Myxococcales bacterium]